MNQKFSWAACPLLIGCLHKDDMHVERAYIDAWQYYLYCLVSICFDIFNARLNRKVKILI